MQIIKPNDIENALVIAGTGIGNILLATPIIRSLKAAAPKAHIDVLAPAGRSDILCGNPDINRIIPLKRNATMTETINHTRNIFRKYDLTLSAQAGDRYIIQAWLAGKQRYSHAIANPAPKKWQRFMLNGWVGPNPQTHCVLHGLQLCDLVNIPRQYTLVPPVPSPEDKTAVLDALPFNPNEHPFTVIHPYPRNRYKSWTIQGWLDVIDHLHHRGSEIVISGGHASEELKFIQSLQDRANIKPHNLAQKLTLPQVTYLLTRARGFIGPDTGITHLAAACRTPTIGLFGPTRPTYWSPWPCDYATPKPPFADGVPEQRVNNVYLVQRHGTCINCGKEGCNHDPSEASPCMLELPSQTVIKAIDTMITTAA